MHCRNAVLVDVEVDVDVMLVDVVLVAHGEKSSGQALPVTPLE